MTRRFTAAERQAIREWDAQDDHLHVRCSKARLKAYHEAAEKADAKDFTSWVLATLDMGMDMDLGKRGGR